MRRYWVPSECIRPTVDGAVLVHLSGDILHHIRDVCRQGLGSKFEVIAEVVVNLKAAAKPLAEPPRESQEATQASLRGVAFFVEIVQETKKESIARMIESRVIAPLPTPHLHLALSIPRLPVLEAVVEKAVELGVTAIHPFYSDFSFVRTQTDVLDKKRSRLDRIIQSATQQSGRGEKMDFHDAVDLKTLLTDFNREGRAQGLFAYEGSAVLSAREGIENMRTADPREVWAFIGSEGGFSHAEVELFQSFGLKPVTLGAQVLRVETACVATLSIIKYGFELMRSF